MAPITRTPRRFLDFDIETIAAGFADPQWVPQKVTVIAWSWVGSDEVHYGTRLDGIENLLERFREAYDDADVVTGHNLIRFDLPILNSEYLRVTKRSLGPKLVQDTMRIVRTKGFKKGQDNTGKLLRLPVDKLPLSWQEWQDAYDEEGWHTVIERCRSDVIQHKLMRKQMLELGWLKGLTTWRP